MRARAAAPPVPPRSAPPGPSSARPTSSAAKARRWDCSGLTQWALAQAGVTIPRTSFDQFNAGTPVARENIQAGDLVFFDANGPGASHVGIATSNATVISATTHGVREHAIGGDYWGTHF